VPTRVGVIYQRESCLNWYWACQRFMCHRRNGEGWIGILPNEPLCALNDDDLHPTPLTTTSMPSTMPTMLLDEPLLPPSSLLSPLLLPPPWSTSPSCISASHPKSYPNSTYSHALDARSFLLGNVMKCRAQRFALSF
jgi:hypothetical protein